jgi:hypothetical protein
MHGTATTVSPIRSDEQQFGGKVKVEGENEHALQGFHREHGSIFLLVLSLHFYQERNDFALIDQQQSGEVHRTTKKPERIPEKASNRRS